MLMVTQRDVSNSVTGWNQITQQRLGKFASGIMYCLYRYRYLVVLILGTKITLCYTMLRLLLLYKIHSVINHFLTDLYKKKAKPAKTAPSKDKPFDEAELDGREPGLPVTVPGPLTPPVAPFLTEVMVVEAATAPGTGVVPLTISCMLLSVALKRVCARDISLF